MAKDFSAKQIRTNTLIASGGIAGAPAGLGLVVYSASVASNFIGGHSSEPEMFADVGTDVFFFISGSKDSKVARHDAGNGESGVTLFGGDVVFSGTMYADKMVVELDLSTTGSVTISGSLIVSQSAQIKGRKTIYGRGLTNNAVALHLGHLRHAGQIVWDNNDARIFETNEPHPDPVLGGSPSLFLSSSSRIKLIFPEALYGYGSDIRLTATGSENNTVLKNTMMAASTGGSIVLSASNNFEALAGNYVWLSGSIGAWIADNGASHRNHGKSQRNIGDGDLYLSASRDIVLDVGDDFRLQAGDAMLISGSSAIFATKPKGTLGSSYDYFKRYHNFAGVTLISGSYRVINIGEEIISSGSKIEIRAGDIPTAGGPAAGDVYISGSGDIRVLAGDEISIYAGGGMAIRSRDDETPIPTSWPLPVAGNIFLSASDDYKIQAGNQMFSYADYSFSFVENSVQIQPGLGTYTEARSTNWAVGTDISFAVSGAVGTRGVANSLGTSMFAGDVVISGSLATLGGFSSALYHENPVSPFTSPVASGDNAIAMGTLGTAGGSNATLGGGYGNVSSDTGTTVAGGFRNSATDDYASIGGGRWNLASGKWSTIGGGIHNTGSDDYSVVGGGYENDALAEAATIVGGKSNNASAYCSTIAGGEENIIGSDADNFFIGAGTFNTGSSDAIYGVLAGGSGNNVKGAYGVIVGGFDNLAGDSSGDLGVFIGGGADNTGSEDYSAIVGGRSNTVSGQYSAILGGRRNLASGYISAVLGSSGSTASGAGTIAIGTELTASENNTIHIGGGGPNNTYTAVISGSFNVLGDRPESKVNIFAGELNPTRAVASAGSILLSGSNDISLTAGDGLISSGSRINIYAGDPNPNRPSAAAGTIVISGSNDVQVRAGDEISILTKDIVTLGVQGSAAIDYIKINGEENTLQINPDLANIVPVIKGLNKVGFTMSYTGNGHEDQVLILSGGINETGGGTSIDERGYSDMNFFVSGTMGSRGTAIKGTSVFGGDVVISGSLYGGSPMSVGNTTEVSGALYLQDQASAPGIADSGGSVLYSRAGTLYFKPAGGAESSLGGGWVDEGAYLRLDTLTDRVTLGGTSVPPATLQVGDGTGQTGHIIVTGGNTVSASISFSKSAAATNAALVLDNNENIVLVQSGSGDLVLKTAGGLNYLVGDIPAAGSSQVLILSGTESDPTGLDPRLFTDCNFFVSGAIGQRGIHPTRGTSVFGGDVVASGSLYALNSLNVSEYIKHIGDTNTTVRFETDKITLNPGGVRYASFDAVETTISLNPDQAAISTVIQGQNKMGVAVDGSLDRVLILSGGGGTSVDESDYVDTSFFVSGSVSSRGTQTRGTSLFGGDVVTSGSMYVEGADLQISDALRHMGDTDTYIQFANDQIYVMGAGTVGMHINHSSSPRKTTFSETGGEETNWEFIGFGATGLGDTALYIEGDGTSSSGASQVGILTSSPTAALHVNGAVKMDAAVTLGNAASDDITFSGHAASHLIPKTDSTYDLGSVSNRWANVYTGDLHLRNEKGSWTIQEDADKLIVINNITGKKYKMVLAPLEENE